MDVPAKMWVVFGAITLFISGATLWAIRKAYSKKWDEVDAADDNSND